SDSLPRRSAQTAMQHIIEAMVRWIAPILSFTADEMWPVIAGDRSQSVFVAEWYQLPELPTDSFDNTYWELIAQVKDAVNKVLEAKRTSGEVGGSLGAEVTLYCDAALQAKLQKLGNELRFVLITSTAEVLVASEAENAEATDVSGLYVFVKKSEHAKCARCWHHRADVGANTVHSELCLRCIENVDGAGEARSFA
ncbi:MAG: isoleucine--tRNA ligase, partial [Moraxellaceae bacterium]